MSKKKNAPLYKVGDRIKVKTEPSFQKWAAGGEFVVDRVVESMRDGKQTVFYTGADFVGGVWEENISHRIETIESLKNPFPPKERDSEEYDRWKQGVEDSLRFAIEAGVERTRAQSRADALEAWFTDAMKSMITHYEWAEDETRRERADAEAETLDELVAYTTGIIHTYSALRHTLADMLVQYDELRARLTPVEPDEDVIR